MEPELVAIRLPHAENVITAVERVWSSGGAALPLDPAAPDAVVGRILSALRPAALIQPRPGSGTAVRRLPGAQPVPPGTAFVVATSGTTGEPKGVELARAAVDHAVRASVERLGCEQGDRWLACLPMHHVAGLLVWLRSRLLGTDPVLHDTFNVDAVAGETRARHVSLVPTMLARLLDAGADLSRFDSVLLGGAAAPPGLVARAREAGVPVVVSYGMTETCGGCVYDGVPLDGVEVNVEADGRIWLRGAVLMRGYRGRADLTTAMIHDGWLRTADVGRIDDDGRLEVLGRADDVIITGGENVAASAVARLLRHHPKVADAAVVGRPDDEWGQVVVAVCVPRDPADPPTLAELRAHVAASMPAHAAPRERWLVDALPRNDMGKLSATALTRLVTGG